MKPKFHRRACGLPLCPWKDGVTSGQARGHVHQGETDSGTPANVGRKRRKSDEQAAKLERQGVEQPVSAPESSKKRKGWLYHPDRPSFHDNKRARISYDDMYTREPSPPPSTMGFATSAPSREVKQGEEKSLASCVKTCFFW